MSTATDAQHVIATMRLAAAAAHRTTTVRRVVMASSTRVYPVSSRAARLHPESEPLQPRRGSLAAPLVEAEGYVRDLATTNPNLSASILRLADLAGPGTHDPLPSVLAGPVVPAVWGFDPPVQLLHVDDAVAALEHAADHDLAGVYNVGADELVRWRRAARLARKPLIELPRRPGQPLARLLRWVYRLDAGDDILDVLRFGRGAATDAFTRSGFRPTQTTARGPGGAWRVIRSIAGLRSARRSTQRKHTPTSGRPSNRRRPARTSRSPQHQQPGCGSTKSPPTAVLVITNPRSSRWIGCGLSECCCRSDRSR